MNTVQLSTPTHKKPAYAANAARKRTDAAAGLRVLIVADDETSFKSLCAEAMRARTRIAGVHWVDDYEDAHATIRRGCFDVLILDSTEHAADLARDLSEFCPGTPAIVVGGTLPDTYELHEHIHVSWSRENVDAPGLARTIDDVVETALAARLAMRSQLWWRSGGHHASRAFDIISSPTPASGQGLTTPRTSASALLESALRQLPIIAGSIDAAGRIVDVNGGGLEHHGLQRSHIEGRQFLEIFTDGREAFERAQSGEVVRFDTDVRSEGTRPWVAGVDLFPAGRNGRRTHISFLARQIEAPQPIEGELMRAVDAERHRIGADLHDEVGQLLTGLTCLGTALSERLRGRDDLAAEDAGMIAATAKEALAQVRALAHGLAPVHLARQGLGTVIEELGAQVRRMHNVEVHLDLQPGLADFEGETTAHVFRIVQEAIANAVRHGKASTVHVSLRRTRERHVLTIADNGCGFDANNPSTAAGSGLSLMEYRATLINGNLSVTSDSSNGTRIEVSFSPSHTDTHETAC